MALRRLVKVGGVEVALAVNDGLARRIRESSLWRGAKDQPAPADAGSLRRPARPASPRQRELLNAVAAIDWYHTIPLADGIVTPGQFDHAPYREHYRIPDRLDGKRVLDVATYDGYWAFEFERRGAAEVVALDIGAYGDADIQPRLRAQTDPAVLSHRTGAGFAVASAALGSRVRRQVLNVYDISPEILGTFDFVFCGDLLLHLMNPVRAIASIRSVVRGEAHFVDCYSPHLPGTTAEYRGGATRMVWWSFSLDCLHKMFRDAGFTEASLVHTFKLGHRGENAWMARAVFKARP